MLTRSLGSRSQVSLKQLVELAAESFESEGISFSQFIVRIWLVGLANEPSASERAYVRAAVVRFT